MEEIEFKPTSTPMILLNRALGYKIVRRVDGCAPKELSDAVIDLMKFPGSLRAREEAIIQARKFAAPGPFGKAAEVVFKEGDLEAFCFHPELTAQLAVELAVDIESEKYYPRLSKTYEEVYKFFHRYGSESSNNFGFEVDVWRGKGWYLHPDLFIDRWKWEATDAELISADGRILY